jgi:hypothetical protein
MHENLDNEELRRMWEHRLHVDNEFYSRLNFFLIFESVLIGAVGALYSKANQVMLVLRVIAFLGLGITLVWSYVQARHKYLLDAINALCREKMPEYKATIEYFNKSKWPLSTRWLLAYVIPTLIVLVWVILIFLFFLQ